MMRRAFTMFELLITVLIVAVLAAIAVPNFLEAQTRSKVASTRMDMAALGLALESYYSDWRQYPPHHPTILAAYLFATDNVGDMTARPPSRPSNFPADFWEEFDPFESSAWGGLEPDLALVQTSFTLTIAHVPPIQHLVERLELPHHPRPPSPSPQSITLSILMHAGSSSLNRLTTPVAYVEHNLPLDTFHDNRNTTIQYVDVATIDRMRPEATKHLRPRRYFLMSYGPDADGRTNFTPPRDHQQFPDLSADEAVLFVGPVSRSTEHLTLGPYTSYDPTNGSISRGDIYHWGIGTGEVGLGPYREQRRQ